MISNYINQDIQRNRTNRLHLLCVCLVAQSCPILCDPVDYSPPGIFQARILKQVAISCSGGSSWHRDWIGVSSGVKNLIKRFEVLYFCSSVGPDVTRSQTLGSGFWLGEKGCFIWSTWISLVVLVWLVQACRIWFSVSFCKWWMLLLRWQR